MLLAESARGQPDGQAAWTAGAGGGLRCLLLLGEM